MPRLCHLPTTLRVLLLMPSRHCLGLPRMMSKSRAALSPAFLSWPTARIFRATSSVPSPVGLRTSPGKLEHPKQRKQTLLQFTRTCQAAVPDTLGNSVVPFCQHSHSVGTADLSCCLKTLLPVVPVPLTPLPALSRAPSE